MQLNRDQYRDSHLSTEELLDYLHDRCWDHERHEIERHLMECPMCREALEGLKEVERMAAEEDLANLSDKLAKRTGRMKPSFKLLAIAASVSVLLVSMVLVGRFMLKDDKSEDLALNSEKTTPETEQIEESSLSDKAGSTVSEEEDEKPTETVQLSEQESIAAESTMEPVHSEEVFDEESENQLSLDESVPTEQTQQELIVEQADKVDEAQEIAFADEDMSFGATEEDVILEEEIAPSITSFESRKSDETAASPAFKEKKPRAKRLSATGAVQRSSAPEPNIEPEPSIGYDQFEMYLRRNLVYPPSALQDSIQGTVVLQFSVDEVGGTGDFRVLRGLSNDCDDEAIRLVEEGPAWVPGSSNGQAQKMPVSITVQFKLN